MHCNFISICKYQYICIIEIRITKYELRVVDRQYNGKMEKDKMTKNDLQDITHQTNLRATRTLLKSRSEL